MVGEIGRMYGFGPIYGLNGLAPKFTCQTVKLQGKICCNPKTFIYIHIYMIEMRLAAIPKPYTYVCACIYLNSREKAWDGCNDDGG